MLGGLSCTLPISWQGDWYESDVGRVTITTTDVSTKGTCVDTDHNFFLLENRSVSVNRLKTDDKIYNPWRLLIRFNDYS